VRDDLRRITRINFDLSSGMAVGHETGRCVPVTSISPHLQGYHEGQYTEDSLLWEEVAFEAPL
jgi:hypothetical protein